MPKTRFFTMLFFVTALFGAGTKIPLDRGWNSRDNGKATAGQDGDFGPVLRIDGTFSKISYTWARCPMGRGDLTGRTVKGLSFSARSEEVGQLLVVLGWKDGGTEVKFGKEIPVGPGWKTWTLPLAAFQKSGESLTPEAWEKCEWIMWFLQKPKGAVGSLTLAAVSWVDDLPSPASTAVRLLDLSKENQWKGAVSVVEAPDRPGQKALRLDGSVPDGMILDHPPVDWSAADTLYMEIHSAKETGAVLDVVLHSKAPGSRDMSYLKQELKVNWKGWKTLALPFSKFKPSRNPVGFTKIDQVQWAVDGWGHKAVAGTELTILSMEARMNPDKVEKAPPPAVTAAHQKDLATIQARATETLIPDLATPLAEPGEAVTKALDSLGEDGSWPDVNYGDKSRATWAPAAHLDRLAIMTIAWVRLGVGKTDEGFRKKLKNGIDRALEFWFKRDPQSDNWWHNMIGAQLTLSRIALALDPVLTAEQREGLVKIFKRSNPDGMTGGNLTWTGGLTIIRACLERKADVAVKAFGLIADEIRMAQGDEEGVKIDGSFHQHGQQVYNSGYGSVYAVDASRFMYYAAGTAFQFPEEKADVLATYALDGSRWMLYRNVFDYSGRGREITRPVKGFGTSYLAEVCRNLKIQPGPRQAEIIAFHGELTNKVNRLVGNKHFWKSDYMVHRRPDFMFSVKMLSSRMQSGELVNDEGRKSHLLSDGLTYLYQGEGKSYHNIFPVWDWKRLPGITAEWSEEPPAGPVPSRGETSFAGGVSEGGFGAAAMSQKRGGLEARKAWFFFDGGMVVLGSGIQGKAVNTTLDQSLLSGEVRVRVAGKESSVTGEGKYGGDLEFVHHRGLAFIPMAEGNWNLKVGPRTGSWKEISGSQSGTPITENLMTLWLDHGDAKGAGFGYAVVATNVEGGRDWAAGKPVRILSRTESVLAVEWPKEGMIMAAFFDAGGFRTGDGVAITTDGPAMLLIREAKEGALLSVSQPECREGILGVTVNKKLTGTGASWESSRSFTRIRIPLPGGDEAGKTVTVGLKAVK